MAVESVGLSGESFLLRLSQIGIVFAGFTSLVGAFRQASREWTPTEINGLKLMLEHNLAEVLFALLPFPLFYLFRSEQVVWGIASLFLVFFLAFEWFIQYRRAQRVPPRRPPLFWCPFLTSVLFCLIQLLNVALWRSVSAYALGLLWLLVPPALQFQTFLFFLEGPRRGANDTRTDA